MQTRYDNQMEQGVSIEDKYYHYSDSSTDTGQAISVAVYQTEVRVTLSDGTDTATATLTLPSVAEARGRTYNIRVLDVAGGVTIQDRDDSVEWSDLSSDANGEYVTLYSDGQQWVTLNTDM